MEVLSEFAMKKLLVASVALPLAVAHIDREAQDAYAESNVYTKFITFNESAQTLF